MIKKLLLFGLFSLFSLSVMNIASARWATPDEANLEIKKISRNIYVNKDGTHTETYEVEAKILKDDAKAGWAPYPFLYNADTTKIKILDAKTIANGKTYPVQSHDIEDKPVSSESNSFDQTNQLSIFFSNLETNAIVYFKYQSITDKTALHNFYADAFSFGDDGYSKSANILIRSELPLYVEANDPDHVLAIKQTTQQEGEKKLYVTEISQNKPIYKHIIDEEKPLTNPKHIPWVSVSSMNNWNDYGKAFAIEYEKIKQQPLPKLYQEIANAAKIKTASLDKINTVTSLLAQKITYLSDSRTIKGAFIPQPLQKVADSRLGDCKDFSMATAVILQSIGIPTKLALVMRGEDDLPFPNHLPGPGHANHAILQAQLPEGPLWIDPTNFVSMANHIFPDIANRHAIVLNIHHSSYETIPQTNQNEYQTIRREVWDMQNPAKLQIKGSIQLIGIPAIRLCGATNKNSEESVKRTLIEEINHNYGHILEQTVTLPDLSSTIVKDLSFAYAIIARNSGLKTNAGTAIPLSFTTAEQLVTKPNTVSDIYVGTPAMIHSYITIQNISPIGTHSLNCKIESPWVDIARTVKYEKNQVSIHQQMQIKKSWIPGDILESEEYKKLQLELAQNFNNGMAIIFKPKK